MGSRGREMRQWGKMFALNSHGVLRKSKEKKKHPWTLRIIWKSPSVQKHTLVLLQTQTSKICLGKALPNFYRSFFFFFFISGKYSFFPKRRKINKLTKSRVKWGLNHFQILQKSEERKPAKFWEVVTQAAKCFTQHTRVNMFFLNDLWVLIKAH